MFWGCLILRAQMMKFSSCARFSVVQGIFLFSSISYISTIPLRGRSDSTASASWRFLFLGINSLNDKTASRVLLLLYHYTHHEHCFRVRTHICKAKWYDAYFRCTGPASTVFIFLRFLIALGINSGGVFNTLNTGLCVLSRVFLDGNYTKGILWYDFIHITAVHLTGLNVLFHSYFYSMSEMFTSILPLLCTVWPVEHPRAWILGDSRWQPISLAVIYRWGSDKRV